MTGLLLVGAALANPKVIEIKVPDPTPAPPAPRLPPPAPADAAPAEGASAQDASGTDPGAPRPRSTAHQGIREVTGVTPSMLSGRYTVVQVTKGGETENYSIKMDREGRALKQDCITHRLVFDFGRDASAQLPNLVSIAEQQQCTKGGFGSYANEIEVEFPVKWVVEADGRIILSLPPVEATASLVRVRPPTENNDLNTPSHWLGPVTRMERSRIDLAVVVEPAKPAPRKRNEPEVPLPPAVIHLVGKDVIYHLEPEPEAGLFADPAAGAPGEARAPADTVPDLMPIRP